MKRFVGYNVLAFVAYIGHLFWMDGFPGKPLHTFAAWCPGGYPCWLMATLFATFYMAAWASFDRQTFSLEEIAIFSAVSAFLSSAFTLMALLFAAQSNLVAIN